MKRLSIVGFIIFCVGTVIAEIVSWSIPWLAFSFSFSVVGIGIMVHSLSWPRPAWLAIGLGVAIDLFAPAPFGLWTVSLILLAVTAEWIKTTWLKQASILSVFVGVSLSMVVATIPLWLWLAASFSTSAVSPVIQLVPWWHWPVGWLMMAVLVAMITRIIPSPYERFL